MLEKLNRQETIIIIGRAHSGTRILPEALKDSGVYFGEPLNVASDLLPEHPMYEACRIFGPFVDYLGNYEWDFTRVLEAEIPATFIERLETYLKVLIDSDRSTVGWKIPNSNLIYPWLVRLFPKATFIHWTRHPEGATSVMMGIDRLEKWNVPCKKFLFHDFNFKVRAASWKYHVDIVHRTPRPERFLEIRFEDYVADQKGQKKVIEELVGIELKELDLDRKKAWKPKQDWRRKYPFLTEPMDALKYE
ncbi:MAG: sulfotransferase [Flavobacteriales bacterium]|nr:sulfotransferase [Flavobacteriales bacterium]